MNTPQYPIVWKEQSGMEHSISYDWHTGNFKYQARAILPIINQEVLYAVSLACAPSSKMKKALLKEARVRLVNVSKKAFMKVERGYKK